MRLLEERDSIIERRMTGVENYGERIAVITAE
jgi:hypothetical protein